MSERSADPRTDRYVGALLGVHAGDSLGATVEFMPWAQLRLAHPDGVRDIVGGGPFDWPPGHATDDTDLTRAVLLGYLDRLDGDDRDDRAAGVDASVDDHDVVRLAADHMLDWFTGRWPDRTPGSRPRDIGGATLTGLSGYRDSGDPRACGAGVGRAGNGSLMRCIATALATGDPQRRVQESVEISAVTHDDPGPRWPVPPTTRWWWSCWTVAPRPPRSHRVAERSTWHCPWPGPRRTAPTWPRRPPRWWRPSRWAPG